MNVEISAQLISMFESSNDPWGIKLFSDKKSVHIYSNEANCDLLNLPSSFNIEGKSDDEIPHPTSEFAGNFQKHDFEILKQRKSITSIDIYHYGRKSILQPYYCEKFPFFNNENECIGVMYHAKKFILTSCRKIFNFRKPQSLTCTDNISGQSFTEKEIEIIFLTVHHFSSKEAGKILGISNRTIENRLRVIYQKTGINSISQLIEFSTENNIDHYIPSRLLNMGSLLDIT